MSKHNNVGSIFFITDLEGVSGVTRFDQAASGSPEKPASMRALTAEVNAVIKGIRAFDASIDIYVWDGHGAGGLVEEEMLSVEGIFTGKMHEAPAYFMEKGINALGFIGQHAMSYTVHGNLCHTMSHVAIHYYLLNGQLVGEFGFWAAVAGELGIPVIYVSGDDKACLEAGKQVPGITTTITKQGTGWESAICRPPSEVHEEQSNDIQRAIASAGTIAPFDVGIPITLEIAVTSWTILNSHLGHGAQRRGTTTAIYHAGNMVELLRKL